MSLWWFFVTKKNFWGPKNNFYAKIKMFAPNEKVRCHMTKSDPPQKIKKIRAWEMRVPVQPTRYTQNHITHKE